MEHFSWKRLPKSVFDNIGGREIAKEQRAALLASLAPADASAQAGDKSKATPAKEAPVGDVPTGTETDAAVTGKRKREDMGADGDGGGDAAGVDSAENGLDGKDAGGIDGVGETSKDVISEGASKGADGSTDAASMARRKMKKDLPILRAKGHRAKMPIQPRVLSVTWITIDNK